MASEREGTGGTGDDGVVYRMKVAGRVPASWLDWFEADAITPDGPDTLLGVRVADQAELYGRLRRIHDLNLRLLRVERLDAADPGPADGARPGADRRDPSEPRGRRGR